MEGCISVVIPTILKNIVVLQKLIDILNKDNSVNEIIVINNSRDQNLYLTGSKVKIHNTVQNMYVNKSWNYGVSLASNDIVLIMNDDILCVDNFCSYVLNSKILEKEDTGLVGIDNGYIKNYNKDVTTDIDQPNPIDEREIGFRQLNRDWSTGDWGSAFFFKKKNWYNIPEDLKIIFGDNYLLRKNLQNNKINYRIVGLPFNHIHSLSSSDSEFEQIIIDDIFRSYVYFPENKDRFKR